MEVPDEVRSRLMELENVIGVGVGPKRVGGEETDEMAVIVFVTEKVPEAELAPEDVCPKSVSLDGEELRTDVIESGEVRALDTLPGETAEPEPAAADRTERHRPAPAGVSTAHVDVTAGTLGTPPLSTADGDLVFLTNAHVAAPVGADEGDPCLQPGPADDGTEDDVIGTLAEYVEVSRDEPNETDSALVAVEEDVLRDNEILEIGALAGWAEPSFGETYEKSGRTTAVTSGELVARDVEIDVAGYYPDEEATFVGVDAFGPMAEGGDSGSLIGVHDEGFRGTNLLFAGGPQATFGIPMEAVQEHHGSLSVANPPSEDDDGEGGGNGDGGGDSRSLLQRIIDWLRRLFGV